jgi:2'-5' RNA ligase
MTQTNLQTYEAAIVALVPEVESLVEPFRVRYDSSAAAGMPAHITINYPFTPRPIQDDLGELFSGHAPFEFMLSRVERWPDVLYLAPEPSVPFIELIEHVTRRFPESPPYGGLFPDVVPHLTIANSQDNKVLAQVTEEFGRVSAGRLPVTARLEELWLMDNQEGRWRKRLRLSMS